MTNRIDEIGTRLEAATRGDWSVGPSQYINRLAIEPAIGEVYGSGVELEANAALIANAPADIRYLLAEVNRLRKAIRLHRDYTGNDCPDQKLWAVLGEQE